MFTLILKLFKYNVKVLICECFFSNSLRFERGHEYMRIPRLNKGFTLIELLVVIAIIGILAGILLPVLSRARESARKTQCMSNVKQIGMGLIMYANENSETFPSSTASNPAMASLNLLYDTYISDNKVFNCTSDTTVTAATNAGMSVSTSGGTEAFTSTQCSYGYDRAHTQADDADVALAADRPPATPSATASTANHNSRGQNVVYVDGHVEFVNSPLAGWYSSDGTTRDNIYLNTAGNAAVSTGGTDTAILHDG